MQGPVTFRVHGLGYQLDREAVLASLKNAQPERLQTHSVLINGLTYPVKQAFSVATGIDRLDFVTSQARSVFQRLGFEVKRAEATLSSPSHSPAPRSNERRQAKNAPRTKSTHGGKEDYPMTFQVNLARTYWLNGFFNARVEFDRYLAPEDCGVTIVLGDSDRTIQGRIDRGAQLNETARIFGGAALRDHFQSRFKPGDRFDLEILSPTRLRIS